MENQPKRKYSLTDWVLKKGLIRTEAAAEIFLLIIAIGLFTMSAHIFAQNNLLGHRYYSYNKNVQDMPHMYEGVIKNR
jgi:hypothetical protein